MKVEKMKWITREDVKASPMSRECLTNDHEDEEAFKYGFDAGRNQDSPRVCECGHLEKEHDLYDAVTRERMDCLVGVFKGMEINAQICPCSKFRLQGRVKHENA